MPLKSVVLSVGLVLLASWLSDLAGVADFPDTCSNQVILGGLGFAVTPGGLGFSISLPTDFGLF